MEETPKRHIACGICRRRKLKCDGKKPSCSTCQRLNQVCEYSDVVRKAGPKRGYVRSLESRVAQLEKLLNEHNISETSTASYGSPQQPESNHSASPICEEPLPPRELVQDLTDAFFLKVNIIHGVLDRKRYTTALSYPQAHQPPLYLQYTVMAYAAALTPKYRSVKPMLYERAIKYLTKAESAFVDGTPSIYYIVALGLMAHFKTREGQLRMAWLDVGKAWRAIIMLSLNMLDAASWDSPTYDTPAVSEARRAFWFIYFCDRAGTLALSLPPVINPDDVFVKLPMDDEAFFMSTDQSERECFKLEDLLQNPNLFIKYPVARMAFTTCLVELNYQILELGRFPKKNKNITGHDWFAQYTHFDNILQKLIAVVPMVPPVPASGGDEENKVIIGEKSRRTAVLIIYLWAQAGLLFSCRTGLYGIQQYPMLLTMANPGRIIQRSLMSMLEVLLVTRNPHDLEVIGMHPVHPYILFALAVIIVILADHNLVSLDNFRAPVDYIMSTLIDLVPIMPCTEMFSSFLGKLAPHFAALDSKTNVARVEDVLVTKTIDLSLPNFLDGNPLSPSNESSPLSMISTDGQRRHDITTPSPQGDPSYTYTPRQSTSAYTPATAPHPEHMFSGSERHQSHPAQPGMPAQPAHSMHPRHPSQPGQPATVPSQPQQHLSPIDMMESPTDFLGVYDEPYKDALLDLDPPIYLPEVKDEPIDLEASIYDKPLEWSH